MYKKIISFVIFCLIHTTITSASSPKSVSFDNSVRTQTRTVNLNHELVRAIKHEKSHAILYWLQQGANPNFAGYFIPLQHEPISAFDLMLQIFPHEEIIRRCLSQYGAQLSTNSDRATDNHPRHLKEHTQRIRRIIAAHRQQMARKEINDRFTPKIHVHKTNSHVDPTLM